VNDEEFSWLVARLENQSANAPRAFRAKVLLISVAGYIALFLGLLFSALLLYWAATYTREHHVNRFVIGAGVLGLMSLPMFYVTLKTLLTPLPPPQGRVIVRAEAPILFGLLDKMRVKLKGPEIHHVLIDEDYNAHIVQRARWGLIGPSVNYLALGLPFMLGHGTSEMLSVVAHEYGHLCAAHGRINNWVWRQRVIFQAMYARVEEASDSSIWYGLMWKALHAFMPYFNAYTFVLSRQDEYEADAAAAKVAGAAAASTSLVRTTLLADWFHEQFWPTLYRQADKLEKPTIMPYKSIATAFRMSHAEWATDARLKTALLRDSDVDDTHPCLRERVAALGELPGLPPALGTNAAVTLLGPALADRLAEEFDQAWWRNQADSWRERYRRVMRSQERLLMLQASPLASLSIVDLQELALLKNEFESAQAAKPVLEHLLRQPGGPYPKASCLYGRILLDEQRHEGLDYLAEAARHDKRLAEEALHAGFHFILERDGEARAHRWLESVSEAEAA
jgi:hypothetical protein